MKSKAIHHLVDYSNLKKWSTVDSHIITDGNKTICKVYQDKHAHAIMNALSGTFGNDINPDELAGFISDVILAIKQINDSDIDQDKKDSFIRLLSTGIKRVKMEPKT